MDVWQANPGREYKAFKGEIDDAVSRVLGSGSYILGKEVAAFEKEFSEQMDADFCLGVSSGTDAIELALRALGVGPGHMVLTVSHTAVATVAAIERAGATACLVEINEETFTMDPEDLRKTLEELSRRGSATGALPKAVIPVHLYGHPADIESICSIADEYGLLVIEDCAQAHGAEFKGRKVGSWGRVGAYSFYPTKNLGAMGDGGAITTNDHTLFKKMTALRQYGWEKRYVSSFPGINTRLDELQASVLRVKLKHLISMNEKRKNIATLYEQALVCRSIKKPVVRNWVEHVYHQYVICCDDRDGMIRHLTTMGIGFAIHYPLPVHLQPGYMNRVMIAPGGLKRTENLVRKIISLPIHPFLEVEEVNRVCDSVLSFDP